MTFAGLIRHMIRTYDLTFSKLRLFWLPILKSCFGYVVKEIMLPVFKSLYCYLKLLSVCTPSSCWTVCCFLTNFSNYLWFFSMFVFWTTCSCYWKEPRLLCVCMRSASVSMEPSGSARDEEVVGNLMLCMRLFWWVSGMFSIWLWAAGMCAKYYW